jgi:hypothetical protein
MTRAPPDESCRPRFDNAINDDSSVVEDIV